MDKEELVKVLKAERGIDIDIIDGDETFDFKCDQCGRCCTGGTIESIIFKPYDVHKLSAGLKISHLDVLHKYSDLYLGENSAFPIVRLKSKLAFDIEEGPITVCPFRISLDGKNICGVHSFKPGSCKLFPLGRLTTFDKNTKKGEGVHYFLQKVDCGLKGEHHTIKEWISDPSVEEVILKTEGVILGGISEFIDLPSLRDFSNKFPQITQSVDTFYNALLSVYYVEYNHNEPFEVQFERKIDGVLNMVKSFAYSLHKTFDRSNEIGRFALDKVIAKDFTTKYADFIKEVDKHMLDKLSN